MLRACSLPSLSEVHEVPAWELNAAESAPHPPPPLRRPLRGRAMREDLFKPAPSLVQRCEHTDDIFRRFGPGSSSSSSKRRATGAVLHKMQRPADQLGGLDFVTWQASVERLRAAEAHRTGSLDVRPVPSWNFRFNGKKGTFGSADVYLNEGGYGGRGPSNPSASSPAGSRKPSHQATAASSRDVSPSGSRKPSHQAAAASVSEVSPEDSRKASHHPAAAPARDVSPAGALKTSHQAVAAAMREVSPAGGLKTSHQAAASVRDISPACSRKAGAPPGAVASLRQRSKPQIQSKLSGVSSSSAKVGLCTAI